VGFQTDRIRDQQKNPSIFDHCDVQSIWVSLNTEKYPQVNYNLSFPNQQFSRAYRDAATFNEKFYGMDQLVSQSNITPADYKELYPIFVFDTSKQTELLKPSSADIHIEATFNAAVPARTQAYAVIIFDKMLKLQSDGNIMSFVKK
jgi:hypothetical protein